MQSSANFTVTAFYCWTYFQGEEERGLWRPILKSQTIESFQRIEIAMPLKRKFRLIWLKKYLDSFFDILIKCQPFDSGEVHLLSINWHPSASKDKIRKKSGKIKYCDKSIFQRRGRQGLINFRVGIVAKFFRSEMRWFTPSSGKFVFSHPTGFYWGHQCSWTLTPVNSMQVSNMQSDNCNIKKTGTRHGLNLLCPRIENSC